LRLFRERPDLTQHTSPATLSRVKVSLATPHAVSNLSWWAFPMLRRLQLSRHYLGVAAPRSVTPIAPHAEIRNFGTYGLAGLAT